MRKPLSFILVAAFLVAAVGAGAQTTPPKELTVSERALVAGSREAIIETGITPVFFDEHFRLARVVDRPGDRRIMWNFSVGGHTALVNDAVGFYTEGARRVDTHSVGTTLSSTSDITRTITRRRAEQVMRRCIGDFKEPQVEYRAHGSEGRAALLLTAYAVVPPPPESAAARARREREEREAAEAQAQGETARDELRRKSGVPRPVILLGAVDLVTAQCTVGQGQAGSPKPASPR